MASEGEIPSESLLLIPGITLQEELTVNTMQQVFLLSMEILISSSSVGPQNGNKSDRKEGQEEQEDPPELRT